MGGDSQLSYGSALYTVPFCCSQLGTASAAKSNHPPTAYHWCINIDTGTRARPSGRICVTLHDSVDRHGHGTSNMCDAAMANLPPYMPVTTNVPGMCEHNPRYGLSPGVEVSSEARCRGCRAAVEG